MHASVRARRAGLAVTAAVLVLGTGAVARTGDEKPATSRNSAADTGGNADENADKSASEGAAADAGGGLEVSIHLPPTAHSQKAVHRHTRPHPPGFTALLLHPGINLWAPTPPLLLAGTRLGLVPAPLAAIATRTMEPSLTGAASKVLQHHPATRRSTRQRHHGVLLQAHLGDTPTTATHTTLAFPAMLLTGLLCCATAHSAPKTQTA